jgi:hypothetical protein
MDLPEMEAARLRMDDRVRRARRLDAPTPREPQRITHQLRRATRQLRKLAHQVDN